MASPDPEIDQLKQSVSIATLLERSAGGWRVDKSDSTRNAVKYRRGPGEIIIVNHQGQGWFDPSSDQKGDVFSLAQHLNPEMSFGDARKLLRSLAGIAPSYPAFEGKPSEDKPEIPVADRWARRSNLQEGTPAWRYLAEQRGLDAEVLSAASRQGALKQGPYGSAWFPHRDQDGGVVGIEGRGPEYKGFSKGGDKTLFRFAPGGDPPTRIAVAESAIEALSLAQIEKAKNGGEFRRDTLYVATSGGIGPHTVEALHAELKTLPKSTDSRMTIATNNDSPGERLAQRLVEIARETGVPASRLRPMAPINDWNEQVQIAAGIAPSPKAVNSELPQRPSGDVPKAENPQSRSETKMSESNPPNEPPRAARTEQMPPRADVENQRINPGAGAPKAASDNAAKKDPLVELLEQMKKLAEQMPGEDGKKLLREINQFLQNSSDPELVRMPRYRTDIAQFVDNFERTIGEQLSMAGGLRVELTNRLISGADQQINQTRRPSATTAHDDDVPRRNPAQNTSRSDQPSSARPGQREREEVRVVGGARSSFMDGAARIVDTLVNRPSSEGATPAERQRWTTEPGQQNYAGKAVGEAAMGGLRPSESERRQMDTPPPWPPGTNGAESLSDRIARKARESAETKLDPEIIKTQEAGRNAAAAIDELMAGPAKGIHAKISTAAQSEPGGIATVISEMRPDGKYAGLRSEFDGAMLQNEAFSKSYDKAVGALQEYGNQKLGLERRFDQFQQDKGILREKFGGIEEGLAMSAAALPGKQPGKSMIEEFGEKLNEFFQRIVNGVKETFGFNAAPGRQRDPDQGPRAA
jgi:hypothetical protein